MKETLRRIKADVILSAVVCVVLGVVLFVWPKETIDVFCKVLAAALMIMGIVNILTYITSKFQRLFTGILGLIEALVGAWIFLKPESVVSLIPIVIGVILVIHGIQDLKLAMEAQENGCEKCWSMLAIAVIGIALGVLCIVNAFGLVKLATKIIGVALIYDGVSDIWIVNRTVRAAKAAKEEAEVLEVEYKEVDENTEES